MVADTELELVERTIGDLRVAINRDLCVGFAQCVDVSDEAFEMGDDDVVVFHAPERVSRERLIEACRSCPVEALRVIDTDGTQLAP
jgi:ferredoxin